MPRDSSGNYTLDPSNPVVPGTVIDSSWANNTLADIAAALTDSLSRSGSGGMLTPFKFSDGTRIAPGASWVNEPTAGWYRAGSHDFRFAMLGNDVLLLNGNTNTFTIPTFAVNFGNASFTGPLIGAQHGTPGTPAVQGGQADGNQYSMRIYGDVAADKGPVLSLLRNGGKEGFVAIGSNGELQLGTANPLANYTDATLLAAAGLRVRATGILAGLPGAAQLVRLSSGGGSALIDAVDATGAPSQPLLINGSTLGLQIGGVTKLGIDATGLVSISNMLALLGATSGSLNLKAPAIAGAGTLTLPGGTTDFSATGGTGQVVMQEAVGAPFTVRKLTPADIATGKASLQVLKWGAVNMPQATTSFGNALGDNAQPEATAEFYTPEILVIDQLRVATAIAMPAGQSLTATLRRNGADTALTCVVTAGNQSASDIAHSVTYGAGDKISIKFVTTATTGVMPTSATVRCLAPGAVLKGLSYMPFAQVSNPTAPALMTLGESTAQFNTNENNGRVPVPACALKWPTLGKDANGPSTGGGIGGPYLRRNNANVGNTFLNAGTSSTASSFGLGMVAAVGESVNGSSHYVDPTQRVLFSDLDTFNALYKLDSTNVVLSMAGALRTFAIDPASYDPCLMIFSSFNVPQNTSRFMNGWGSQLSTSVEANAALLMPACTVTELRCAIDTAPAAGQTTTVTLRKGAAGALASTAQQVVFVNAGALVLEDLAHPITFNGTTDLLSIQITQTAATGTHHVNATLSVTF